VGEYKLGKIAPKEEHQRKRSNLTHKIPGDINVTTKNAQLNTTMGITGRNVSARKERTVTRAEQKVNTTVFYNGWEG